MARQPIYQNDITVIGYELLYRSGFCESAGHIDSTAAAASLLSAFVEIGLDKLVGSKSAFVNVNSFHLASDIVFALPKDRVVLELLEDTVPDEGVINTLRSLKSSGYRIALDDFGLNGNSEPLLPLADIVKVEILGRSYSDLASLCKMLRCHPVKLLAEKVETYQDFETCKNLGFDFFQGYFFCRPKVVSGKQVPTNKMAALQLLTKIQDPDADLADLARLISGDVALCYKVLRCVNSAAYAIPRRVESIQEALLLLGVSAVRAWASLVLLAGVEEKPSQLMTTAMVRANQCRLLAQAASEPSVDKFFTVGLFSVLDALMDMKMDDILENLPLSDDIKNALSNPSDNSAFAVTLRRVLAYERGEWESVGEESLGATVMTKTYLESVRLAEQLCGSLAAA